MWWTGSGQPPAYQQQAYGYQSPGTQLPGTQPPGYPPNPYDTGGYQYAAANPYGSVRPDPDDLVRHEGREPFEPHRQEGFVGYRNGRHAIEMGAYEVYAHWTDTVLFENGSEALERVARVVDDVPLPARARHRQQVVVEHEDSQEGLV
jgi:hypothetical protein